MLRILSGWVLFAFLFCSCKDRTEAILTFVPKEYRHAKKELTEKFGAPDSVVAFCNRDTSYLFKTKSGCVEWRKLANDKLPYKVQLIESCKIEDARFETYDYVPKPGPREISFDSNGWRIFNPPDSIIGISAIGHWQSVSFEISNSDSGAWGRYFQKMVELDIGKKKSVRDIYCRHAEYLIRFKLGSTSGRIMLGSKNYPDSTYQEIFNISEAATRAFLNEKTELR